MATTFSNKVAILSRIDTEYKNNSLLAEFVRYNDLGLPFATEVYNGEEPTKEMTTAIEESFASLLELANVEDKGFQSLEEILA